MARVKCAICGNTFDYTKVQAVRHGKNRYAHLECEPEGVLIPLPPPKEKRELTDEEKILNYVTNLYGGSENVNYGMIRRQLKNFHEQYSYSYSGMLKTLYYWYEIKHNSPEPQRANYGVGIIPFTYANALNYYKMMWIASESNKNLNFSEFIPKIKEISISPPTVEIKKRKLFTFLDEEQESE